MQTHPSPCSVEGCDRTVIARGWCKRHYRRWQHYGDPQAPTPPRRRKPRQPCTIAGCDAPRVGRGLCRKHYTRWDRYGDPQFVQRIREPGRNCSIEGCNEPHESRGYCAKHATRWRKHGDADVVLASGGWNRRTELPPCAIDGCTELAGTPGTAHGLCRPHYKRLYRYGDPTAPSRRTYKHDGPCLLNGCDRPERVLGLCRPHYNSAANHKRRAILHGLAEHHTADEWRAKLSEYDGACAYCGEPATTKDHVVPISKGGANTIDNIVPACKSCNSRKRDTLDGWTPLNGTHHADDPF